MELSNEEPTYALNSVCPRKSTSMELKDHPKLKNLKVDILPEAIPYLEHLVTLDEVTEINSFEVRERTSKQLVLNRAVSLNGSTLLAIHGESHSQRFFVVIAGYKNIRPLTQKLKDMIEQSVIKQKEQYYGKR